MATTYLSPVGNEQQSDANGAPLAGGRIYTFAAGTLNPIATYTDNAGAVAQQNPITLNASGLPDSPIWLPAGQAVKMIFADANGVASRPAIDNIVGINDPSSGASVSEWTAFPGSPTYISATSLSVAGDQTSVLQVGRRVKTTNSGGTVYSTITASSYNSGTGRTTLTVSNDSGALDSGLSVLSYGLLSYTNPSLPGFLASTGANGYQKLPSGLILQWGTVATSGGTPTATWTYPIPFPTAVRTVQTTIVFGGTAHYASVGTAGNSSAPIFSDVAATVYCFAIGI